MACRVKNESNELSNLLQKSCFLLLNNVQEQGWS